MSPQQRVTAPQVQSTPERIKSDIRAIIKLLISDQDLTAMQPKRLERLHLALDMRDKEGHVLDAIYWCTTQGMEPNLQNVVRCLEINRRLEVESPRAFVEALVNENAEDSGGIATLSSFVQLWLKEKQLAAQGDAIRAIANDPTSEYGEKWDASFNLLMAVAPDGEDSFQDMNEEDFKQLAYKENQRVIAERAAGFDIGPQFPYAAMKAYFQAFKFGEVSLLLGPEGSGKTTSAQTLEENIAWKQKLNCDAVHFSGETPLEVLSARSFCRRVMLPYSRVEDGFVNLSDSLWKPRWDEWMAATRVKANEQGLIRYFHSPTYSVNDIIAGMVRATEASRSLGRRVVFIIDHLLSIDWQKTHGRMDEFAAYRNIFLMLAAAANKLSKRTPNHLFVFSQEGDDKGQMFGGRMPAKRSQYVFSISRTRFGAQDADGNWPVAGDNLEVTKPGSKLSKEQKASAFVEKIKDKNEYRILDAEGNPRYWYRKGDVYSHEATMAITKGNDNPLGRVKLLFEARLNRITQDPDQVDDMRKYGLLPPEEK